MFKSFDPFSKRILSAGISVSMILLAGSVFVFSIQQLNAKEPGQRANQPTFKGGGAVEGIGIQNGRAYYYAGTGLVYVPLDKAVLSPY